jgi:hypothetical protein
MWSAVIVVMPPRLQYFPYVIQRNKLVDVQALITLSSVERLNHLILRRLTRSLERQSPIERHLVSASTTLYPFSENSTCSATRYRCHLSMIVGFRATARRLRFTDG